MKQFYCLIVLCTFICQPMLLGQNSIRSRDKVYSGLPGKIEFERLSVEHGLSQSTVNCILQDSEGYMWFGTLNGLNKYDGYTFKDFRHDPNDPTSISNDQVFSIFEDRQGDLWIGTQDGLNKFNRETENFLVFKHDPSNPQSLSHNLITDIYQDRAGAIWVGTGHGLNRLEKETGEFTRFFRNPNNPISLSHNSINAIFEDKGDNLWIGTFYGLNKLDPSRSQITHFIKLSRRPSLRYVPSVMHAIDTLVSNKNALAAILAIGNSQDVAQKFELNRRSEVLIISVGEGVDKMYDYGWLERNGKKIWQMQLDQTMHAGGSAKNRIQAGLLTLEKGDYTLRYQSDDSHCFNNWNQLPPVNPKTWGIQVVLLSKEEMKFFRNHLDDYLKPSAPLVNNISSITQDEGGILWIGTFGGGLQKLEYGSNVGFVTSKESNLEQPDQPFARFSTYLTARAALKKTYPDEIFTLIDEWRNKKSPIATLLGMADFERKTVRFNLKGKSKVLVLGMGEGSEFMDDYAILKRDQQLIWQMQADKTYHAGGALRNRIQINVLDLAPGSYELSYFSDDLHSYGKWNKLPPEYPELWGTQVFRITESEAVKLKSLLNRQHFSNSIASNHVKAITVDQNGDLWLATARGVSHFNKKLDLFTNFTHDPKEASSLSSSDIQTVYEDKSGTLWIGTVLGGINKLNRNKNRFARFTANPFVENTLTNKIIYSFYEDANGLIWIGTRSGLNFFDRKSGKFFAHQRLEMLNRFPVLKIAGDRYGNIWVGTQGGGLFKISPDSFYLGSNSHSGELLFNPDVGPQVFSRFVWQNNNPKSLGSNTVYSIYEASDGILWIGTDRGGLNRLEEDGKSFTRFTHRAGQPSTLSNNFVRFIYEDSDGMLWVGTHNGLNKYDKWSGKFEHFENNPGDKNSLSHNTITSIYEDKNKNLWVATYGGGLNHLDRQRNTVTRYTEEDGLPNNVLYSVVPDGLGNLWLSTNKGLSRFNLDTRTFKNFDPDNGLQSNEFNTGAYYRCRDGSLLFGGINGFNIIEPARIQDNENIPAIVITSFKKYDQPVKFDKSIAKLNEIKLAHHENFFSFEFSALDYTNPDKNQYAYMLEGFDTDWIHCGNRRYASYTNVDAGEYLFRVKGSNNDGVWNETGATIRVIITPPFWQTWWFFASTSVMIFMALIAAHKYQLRYKIKQSIRMERIRFAERERVREQVSRDYHDELGHKLTKISIFSELVKRNLNGASREVKKYLNKVIQSSESLSGDTRDFIWTLNPEKDNLYDLAVYLKEFGDSLFEDTDIRFEIKNLSEKMKVTKLPMEWKRQLIFIFKEGMNNILKHARCKNASLEIQFNDTELRMTLSDDGSGFDPGKKITASGTGNGLVNMRVRATKIFGQIEMDSANGQGTTIQFHAKLPTNGYIE